MKDRLIPFLGNSIYKKLPADEQFFLKEISETYQLTFQDLKNLIDIARDLQTWNEGSLKEIWIVPESEKLQGKQLKQSIIKNVNEKWISLKKEAKDYGGFHGETDSKNLKINYVETADDNTILGSCPVASEKTRCCNLLTLDVVNNCGFDCTYCSIQSFFDNNRVYFQSNLAEKLDNLKLDPDKRYHIGTGQSSDSLMWGNREGILELICDFAEKNPNVMLELKTKSKNISWFMENRIPRNIIITWSLNTQIIIENEEHLTASLEERLSCAKKVADKGILTGFHFHPIVLYKGWQKDYSDICKEIQKNFNTSQVALISLGTLTFIKPVIRKIRNRELKSKILQMPLQEAGGKLSYPEATKLELFKTVYNSFTPPWKKDVFFYLCMEDPSLWEPVLGRSYKNNKDFENDMVNTYFQKAGL